MAFQHGKDAFYSWNGVDLSSDCNDVKFSHEAALADTSTMGNTAKTYIAGLKDGTISISGMWDGAASKVDATLGGQEGVSAAFEFRANSGARSATNPGYTGTAFLQKFEPSAGVGGAVAFSATFQISGAISRQTS